MIWNTEFTATSTTASSRSPQAKSYMTSTMAMHRARPTMINPVRYAGRSGSISHAKANISEGPMTQFNNNEIPTVRRSHTTLPTLAYFTFANTGYIISSRPIAIGSDTEPILAVFSHPLRPGIVRPSRSPRAIAASIHSGRNRLSRDNRCRTSASSTRVRRWSPNHHAASVNPSHSALTSAVSSQTRTTGRISLEPLMI